MWNFATDMVSSDMTLYARWEEVTVIPPIEEEVTFKVDFDSNSGSAVASIENLEEGSLITKPNDPVRTGFVFKGWYTSNEFKTAWDFSTDMVSSDMTLYARWEEVTVTPPVGEVKPPVEEVTPPVEEEVTPPAVDETPVSENNVDTGINDSTLMFTSILILGLFALVFGKKKKHLEI